MVAILSPPYVDQDVPFANQIPAFVLRAIMTRDKWRWIVAIELELVRQSKHASPQKWHHTTSN